MESARIGQGELIAAISAIVLFLIMFVFTWFGVEGLGRNAWESLGVINVVLLFTIIVAIGVGVMSANAESPNLPVAGSALVAGLGILSVLLILYRIIDPPNGDEVGAGLGGISELGREIGVFLGLGAAGGITYGGFVGMQEVNTSFAAEAERLRRVQQQRGDDPPPPIA